MRTQIPSICTRLPDSHHGQETPPQTRYCSREIGNVKHRQLALTKLVCRVQLISTFLSFLFPLPLLCPSAWPVSKREALWCPLLEWEQLRVVPWGAVCLRLKLSLKLSVCLCRGARVELQCGAVRDGCTLRTRLQLIQFALHTLCHGLCLVSHTSGVTFNQVKFGAWKG